MPARRTSQRAVTRLTASCPLPKALGDSEAEPYREAANRVLHGDALRDRLAGIDRAVSAQLAVCSLTGLRLTEDKAKAYRAAAQAHLVGDALKARLAAIDALLEPEVTEPATEVTVAVEPVAPVAPGTKPPRKRRR